MALSPNLARRPAAPAQGNGHVQRLAQRALLVLGVASTSQIMRQWTCCGKQHRRKPIHNHDNRACRRALDQIADRIGRSTSIGRPILWRLRNSEKK